MSTGLTEYTRPQKKSHRAWVWQQAQKMLRVPIRKARILYLIGPNPEDSTVIKRRGFNVVKAWGCDLDKGAVRRCRDSGMMAIHCNIYDILRYGHDVHFDVVYIDLCCGLCDFVADLSNMLAISSVISSDTVVIVNLLRGRDLHGDFGYDTFKEVFSEVVIPQWGGLIGNHRGKLFCLTSLLLGIQLRELHETPPENLTEKIFTLISSDTYMKRYFHDWARKCHARFATYHSGPQVLDSVAMYMPWHESISKFTAADANQLAKDASSDPKQSTRTAKIEIELMNDVRRKIGAAKAVESMRLSGVLWRAAAQAQKTRQKSRGTPL